MKSVGKTAFGVAGFVLLTGAVLTWRNFAAVDALRARLENARRAEVTQRHEAAEAARVMARAETRGSELEAALKTVEEERAAAKRATSSNPVAAPARPRSLSVTHVIRDEPEAQVWFLEKQRGELRVTYGPFFRQLGLSKGQEAAFVANVLARNEKLMDLDNHGEEGGDAAAIAKLRAAAAKDYEAAQRALLGDEGYRSLEQYGRTSAIRQMVSTIAGVAVQEGVPFTAAQADEAVRVIADASATFGRGGVALMESVDWPAAEARLGTVLSPAQLEVFRTMDPGPTSGGLAQNRFYAEVARANAKQRAGQQQGSKR